jgi:tetratricopeptide (TPR) repeat protein
MVGLALLLVFAVLLVVRLSRTKEGARESEETLSDRPVATGPSSEGPGARARSPGGTGTEGTGAGKSPEKPKAGITAESVRKRAESMARRGEYERAIGLWKDCTLPEGVDPGEWAESIAFEVGKLEKLRRLRDEAAVALREAGEAVERGERKKAVERLAALRAKHLGDRYAEPVAKVIKRLLAVRRKELRGNPGDIKVRLWRAEHRAARMSKKPGLALRSLPRRKDGGDPGKLVPLSAEDPLGLGGLSRDQLGAYSKAKVLVTQKKWARAEKALSRVIAAAPLFGAAYYYRGLCRLKVNRTREAEQDLTAAIGSVPDFFEARALRAQCLVRMGFRDRAGKDIRAVLAIRPDYAGAYRARGYLRFFRRDVTGAVDDLHLAQALNPDDGETHALCHLLKRVFLGPAFRKIRTAHYEVITNAGPEDARKWGAVLEDAYGLYRRELGAMPPAAGRAQAVVFSKEKGFREYTQDLHIRMESWATGCYVSSLNQLVVFRYGGEKRFLQTLYHEAFHQYLRQVEPNLCRATWLNEGFAEYFRGIKGTPRGILTRHRALLVRAKKEGRFPGLRSILRSPAGGFYGGGAAPVRVRYAASWAFVHFIRRGGKLAAPYGKVFAEYVASLKEGHGPDEAFPDTFGRLDPDMLERCFWFHVREMGKTGLKGSETADPGK